MIIDSSLSIRPLSLADRDSIKDFTDQWIGTNYYQPDEIEDILEKSSLKGLNASFGVFKDDTMLGVRLTMAPGKWAQEYQGDQAYKLSVDLWPVEVDKVAYFKSLYLHRDIQGKGVGQKLSLAAIEQLKKMKAKGIVTHSWAESPYNSSRKYLSKLGFTLIKEHPKFWYELDYDCTRCGVQKKCVCTALEMMLTWKD